MKKPSKKPPAMGNPDTQGIMDALHRALRRAHKIAYQTGTNIVTMRDGKVVEVPPDPALYEDYDEPLGWPGI